MFLSEGCSKVSDIYISSAYGAYKFASTAKILFEFLQRARRSAASTATLTMTRAASTPSTSRATRATCRPPWSARAAASSWCSTAARVSAGTWRDTRPLHALCFSVRERAEDLHRHDRYQPVHGGPRLHDGGRYVDVCEVLLRCVEYI